MQLLFCVRITRLAAHPIYARLVVASLVGGVFLFGAPPTFASEQVQIDVKDVGARGDGVNDDTAAVQFAINAAAGVGEVAVPCGTYLINTAGLTLPSNTRMIGKGRCSVIRGGADLAVNSNTTQFPTGAGGYRVLLYNADVPSGDSDIEIGDLTIDVSAMTNGHGAMFYGVNGALIHDVNFVGDAARDGDGLAFLKSSNYVVRNNTARGFANACYDNWWGDSDFVIEGNSCDAPAAGGAGILVTGVKTGNAPATTSRGTITHNRLINQTSIGIWIQGGYNTSSHDFGLVTDVVVTDNIVQNTTHYYNIRVSDAQRVSIVDNVLDGANRNAIALLSENGPGGGRQKDITVKGNKIANFDRMGGGNAAIEVSYTVGGQVSGNHVDGAKDVLLDVGSSGIVGGHR